MTLIISKAEFPRLYIPANPDGKILSDSDSFEIPLSDPKQLSKGYKRRILLCTGLDLLIRDYELQEDLIEEPQSCWSLSVLEFGFHLSGSRQDEMLSPGQNFMLWCPLPAGGTSEWSARQRILKVDIHIELDTFQTLCTNQFDLLPPALRQIVESTNTQQLYGCLGTITSAMHVALHQILNCPYQGLTKQRYLESKALELIGLQLKQAAEGTRQLNSSAELKADDVERIHYAKDILIRNLNNPPSLLALARQVGLNDCTLKKGFRQVFGTTAFGYLYDYRMQQARQLLLERKMKVEEVAHAVGYASRSSFIAAFNKKFGVSPSAYLVRKTLKK